MWDYLGCYQVIWVWVCQIQIRHMDKTVKKKQKFDLSLKPPKNDKQATVPEINLIDDDSSRDAEDAYAHKEPLVTRRNIPK